MYLFHLIQSIPNDALVRVQLGAAIAIYFAIVFAAAALALSIAYESMVQRGDGRPEQVDEEVDHLLQRAA